MVLLLLAGCWTVPDWEPRCVPVDREERATRNLVQPYEVAVDPARRRVYTTSLASGVVGEIDADDGTLLAVHPLRGTPPEYPDLVVDELGDVWVTSQRPPAVFRLPYGDDRGNVVDGPLTSARSLVDVPGGGVLVLGTSDDGPGLQRYDAGGPAGDLVPLASVSRALVDLGDRVGVLQDDRMEVYSLPDLTLVERCVLPFAALHGAMLADGTVLVSDAGRVGRVGCGDVGPAVWRGGEENKDVVAVGDLAYALDRLGGAEAADPNLGLARVFDAHGPLDVDPVVTAKNSGFGAWDPVGGRVWMNSEGTAEVVALDVATGAIGLRTRTGVFIDGMAIDPEVPGRRYLTGRLSNTLVAFGPLGQHAEVDDVFWPYSPVVDVERDVVWVISQTASTLHARDRETLASVGALDAGLPPNTGLTFSTVALHPTRGTLWVAQAQSDELLEIAPDLVGSSESPGPARVVRRWALGGPLITDPDVIGEVAVLVADDGGVLVARSTDGRVQRVDPEGGGVRTTWLDPAGHTGLPAENLTDFARIDGDRLYVGSAAYAAATLARERDHDLPSTRLIGDMPGNPNRRIGLDTTTLTLQSLDVEERVSGRIRYAARPLHAFLVRPEPLLRQVFMARGAQGTVCPISVERFPG